LLVQSLAGSALAAAFQAGPTVTLLVLPFVLSLHQAARGACLLLEADERERLEQVLEETEESLKETSQTAASQAQTIALLDRLHHTLARLNDPQDVADTVVAQAFGLGRLTSVALFVWQEGKARPVAYRSPHAKTLESWEILDCQEPSLETCWKRGKFLQILPKHRKEVFTNESYGLCIPFPEFGVLYLGSTSPLGREVLQAGLRLAEVATPALLKARSFRRQSNALVYHKTAHEQLQEWVERLSLLLEGSRSVATILEPEPLLDRIEDILDRLVPHQGRVIVVHSPELRRMRGLGPEVHPALESLEGAVQSSGRALALQDGEVSRLGPLARDCSALLITPMLTEQGLVGYILLTRSQGEPFQRSDQESLMILSYHLAAMITSVRAHSEVREALRLLKESQQQLTQSAKMAAIGQLAAGVAHELNSPLGAILFGVDICASSLPDPPQSLTRRLEKVRSAAVKAQAIVAKLLFYSRQGNLSDQPFELNSVAHDAVDLLEHHFRLAGVTCTLTLAEDTPVSGNQNELHQVVTNLLINAMDACQEQPADRKTITLETRREGEEIQLIVTDRGCGIPSDHLARVFEPFFTTKPVGKGTGLGLSVCHQIVSQHRGRMSVDSLEGQGTRVLLSLPARAEGLR
jgi:signal transduction histidine kinase